MDTRRSTRIVPRRRGANAKPESAGFFASIGSMKLTKSRLVTFGIVALVFLIFLIYSMASISKQKDTSVVSKPHTAESNPTIKQEGDTKASSQAPAEDASQAEAASNDSQEERGSSEADEKDIDEALGNALEDDSEAIELAEAVSMLESDIDSAQKLIDEHPEAVTKDEQESLDSVAEILVGVATELDIISKDEEDIIEVLGSSDVSVDDLEVIANLDEEDHEAITDDMEVFVDAQNDVEAVLEDVVGKVELELEEKAQKTEDALVLEGETALELEKKITDPGLQDQLYDKVIEKVADLTIDTQDLKTEITLAGQDLNPEGLLDAEKSLETIQKAAFDLLADEAEIEKAQELEDDATAAAAAAAAQQAGAGSVMNSASQSKASSESSSAASSSSSETASDRESKIEHLAELIAEEEKALGESSSESSSSASSSSSSSSSKGSQSKLLEEITKVKQDLFDKLVDVQSRDDVSPEQLLDAGKALTTCSNILDGIKQKPLKESDLDICRSMWISVKNI